MTTVKLSFPGGLEGMSGAGGCVHTTVKPKQGVFLIPSGVVGVPHIAPLSGVLRNLVPCTFATEMTIRNNRMDHVIKTLEYTAVDYCHEARFFIRFSLEIESVRIIREMGSRDNEEQLRKRWTTSIYSVGPANSQDSVIEIRGKPRVIPGNMPGKPRMTPDNMACRLYSKDEHVFFVTLTAVEK